MKDIDIDLEEDDESNPNDFISLYCRKFDCPRRQFEKHIFLQCVYPEGLTLAKIIRLVYPGFFREDFALIDEIKQATSYVEVKKLVDYHGAQNKPNGVLRMILKVRISKQRTLAVAQSLFAGNTNL